MNPFDKNIKERFENFEAGVPADMWERISGKRDDRKPVGWWNWKNAAMLGAILLLVGTGGIIAFNHFAPTDKSLSPARETHLSEKNAVPKQEKTNPPGLKEKSASIQKTILSDPSQIIQADVKQNDAVNISAPNTNPSNDLSEKSNSNKTSNNKDQFSSDKKPQNSLANDRPLSAKYSSIVASSIKNDVTVNAQHQDRDEQFMGNRNRHQKYRSRKTKIQITTVEPEEDDAANTVSEEYAGLRLRITNASLLKSDPEQAVKTETHPSLSFIPCPKAEKNNAANSRYFEVYGGYDLALRSFSDTGNSNYLQKRKESLQQSSAFSAGLRYTKVFNNGMSIRTGLNYSQINEKFKYLEAHIIRTEYIIASNGDTIGSFLSSSSRYKLTHNKYRSIDIPLLLGYEWGNGNFRFNLNAGPVVNIYSWQRGDVLDADFKPVSITTGKNNSAYGFRTNTGLGIMASLSAYYKINERLHVLAEPYFRYNFSQVNKYDITLKQKYNLTGLRLGLRYDF